MAFQPVRVQVPFQPDVERAENDAVTLRRGVAPERRISIEGSEMRHGRKSRRQPVDGYKRHVLRDLDPGLVRAVGVTPANAPEASITDAIVADLQSHGAQLLELHIDRGYLSSRLVQARLPELAVYCQAWPVRNGGRFPKTAFALDWAAGTIRCPNEVTIPFKVGSGVHFPAVICATCPFQARCTTRAQGRSVSIHPDEQLLQELRERQQSPEGRAQLRERVAVEHALAHIGRWQGRRARYRGLRKNLFDVRRAAVIHNRHVIARTAAATQAWAA
jgi:DDE family transposase